MAVRCSSRARRLAAPFLAVTVLAAGLGGGRAAWSAAPEVDPATRLAGLRAEIERFERELADLAGREQGVLGEIDRLAAEERLRRAELERVTVEREQVDAQLAEQGQRLGVLTDAQARRRDYLALRLGAMYRAGPDQALRRLVSGGEVDGYLSGLRYAALLSERDAQVVGEFRDDAQAMRREEATLDATRERLVGLETDLGAVRARLEQSKQQRERRLAAIRDDRARREAAVAELGQAAEELSRVVVGLPGDGPVVDLRKLQGLLEWPADGPVSAGFGNIIHPRFKTRIPHPGLDIEGEMGAPIRAVHDGRVAFAAWMRGYGLTAIVDHGGGILSIYAHASILLVEPGQEVLAGQQVGRIGDSGSLRGPYLYLELRVDGQAVDPGTWLRRR